MFEQVLHIRDHKVDSFRRYISFKINIDQLLFVFIYKKNKYLGQECEPPLDQWICIINIFTNKY